MKLKELYLSLIKEGRKYQISEMEIRYLITDILHFKNSSSFYLKLEQEIKGVSLIKKAFQKLKEGMPLSYITHKAEFLGESFYVDERVLIPRVETEELVLLALKRIEQYFPNKKINILDVGTGSGVIAIKLKKEIKNIKMNATDISLKALEVAKLNAKKHKVKINFYHNDTFPNNKDKYHVIIANPPYIKYKKDVDKSVLAYEPHSSLFINKDNNVYEKIIKSKRFVSPTLLIFEIAPNLVNDLKKIMNKYLNNFVYVINKDINQKERFLSILIKE